MKNNILDKVENGIKKTAEVFNTVAGWAIVISMILVVANIILRTVFKKPILGTYEYTGFLTAIVVGFSIAFCLVQDAHISIDFITQKFSKRAQNILGAATDSVMAVVMGVFTFYIFKYASKLMRSNSVSPTTQFPFYIVVFFVAVCFILLCLVLLVRIKNNIMEAKNES